MYQKVLAHLPCVLKRLLPCWPIETTAATDLDAYFFILGRKKDDPLSSLLSCPKLFLADEDLVLVGLVLAAVLLAAPSHPFGNGCHRIEEVGALPDYGVARGTKDTVHLKEHVLHLAPAVAIAIGW